EPEPLVLHLLFFCPLVESVGEVLRLERILQEVIHLPLARYHAGRVVVLGQLVALLADADDMVRRRRIGAALLARLIVVVGEDSVVLDWRGRWIEDQTRIGNSLPVRSGRRRPREEARNGGQEIDVGNKRLGFARPRVHPRGGG